MYVYNRPPTYFSHSFGHLKGGKNKILDKLNLTTIIYFYLRTDGDTLQLWLCSCSCHPEEGHNSGRNMSVVV
jgi:hypothetical protein